MATIGCGRFNDDQWTQHMLGPGQEALAHHLETCTECATEAHSLLHTAAAVRAVSPNDAVVREQFIDSVLASATAEKQATPQKKQTVRPFPLFGSVAALTAAACILFLFVMPSSQPQFDINQASVPIRSSSVSMMIESDEQHVGTLTTHGVTHAHADPGDHLVTAEPLRTPSGIVTVTASFNDAS